jgi:hypothetical protein
VFPYPFNTSGKFGRKKAAASKDAAVERSSGPTGENREENDIPYLPSQKPFRCQVTKTKYHIAARFSRGFAVCEKIN